MELWKLRCNSMEIQLSTISHLPVWVSFSWDIAINWRRWGSFLFVNISMSIYSVHLIILIPGTISPSLLLSGSHSFTPMSFPFTPSRNPQCASFIHSSLCCPCPFMHLLPFSLRFLFVNFSLRVQSHQLKAKVQWKFRALGKFSYERIFPLPEKNFGKGMSLLQWCNSSYSKKGNRK